jgi:hypothetical protein
MTATATPNNAIIQAAMDDPERSRILVRIADAVGDDAFNRLISSVKEVRQFRRLRFWQEELLRRAGVSISSFTEFLDLFDGAKWRSTGRSKDALTAATRSFWAPILREHGFKAYTRRSYGRVCNECIFQCINLQLSAYGGKSFAVNYASILITRLHEHVASTTFRRLPRGKSHDGWWKAKSHEHADESMLEVCEKTSNIALPWFDATSTVLGLAEELVGLAKYGNPHTFFELGCCFATAGNLAAARDALREAIRQFQQAYDEMPERSWALRERSLAEELVAAIANGTHASLLSRWRDQTFVNLKLDKLRG